MLLCICCSNAVVYSCGGGPGCILVAFGAPVAFCMILVWPRLLLPCPCCFVWFGRGLGCLYCLCAVLLGFGLVSAAFATPGLFCVVLGWSRLLLLRLCCFVRFWGRSRLLLLRVSCFGRRLACFCSALSLAVLYALGRSLLLLRLCCFDWF